MIKKLISASVCVLLIVFLSFEMIASQLLPSQSIYDGSIYNNGILLYNGTQIEPVINSGIRIANKVQGNNTYWNVDTNMLKSYILEAFKINGNECVSHIGNVNIKNSNNHYYLNFSGRCVLGDVFNGNILLKEEYGNIYIYDNDEDEGNRIVSILIRILTWTRTIGGGDLKPTTININLPPPLPPGDSAPQDKTKAPMPPCRP